MNASPTALLLVLCLAGCQPAEPVNAPAAKASVADVADMPDAAPTPAVRTHWQCEELRLSVEPGSDGSVQLAFSGRKLLLANPPSGAKTRYADSAGNTFVLTGTDATLTLAGQPKHGCDRTAQASPWNEATARGIVFRAVGNEPGWFVEVHGGDSPRVRATLDYGERNIEVAQAQALSGLLGWVGRTADGTEVKLLVEREACQDGMSAELFEAKAELTVAGQRYAGCGAFLRD